jgi:toxin ParE1/3/4
VRRQPLLVSREAERDVEATLQWYDNTRAELGRRFTQELRRAYDRIREGPGRYQALRGSVRRALLRGFPYAVYFAVEEDVILVIAVLHLSRDPAEWQRRRE